MTSLWIFSTRIDLIQSLDLALCSCELQIRVQCLQALNFERYPYVRQAHAREVRLKDLNIPESAFMSRTQVNHSESSLGGG